MLSFVTSPVAASFQGDVVEPTSIFRNCVSNRHTVVIASLIGCKEFWYIGNHRQLFLRPTFSRDEVGIENSGKKTDQGKTVNTTLALYAYESELKEVKASNTFIARCDISKKYGRPAIFSGPAIGLKWVGAA